MSNNSFAAKAARVVVNVAIAAITVVLLTLICMILILIAKLAVDFAMWLLF